MKALEGISRITDNIIRIMVDLLVAAMLIVVFTQVIMRYFFSNPLIWAEEFSRFTMCWMTFLGAATACRRDSLSRVDIVFNILPDKIKTYVSIFCDVIMIALSALLLYYSIILLNQPSTINQNSTALRLSMGIVYLCLPIGFGSILIQLITRIIKSISSLCHKSESE